MNEACLRKWSVSQQLCMQQRSWQMFLTQYFYLHPSQLRGTTFSVFERKITHNWQFGWGRGPAVWSLYVLMHDLNLLGSTDMVAAWLGVTVIKTCLCGALEMLILDWIILHSTVTAISRLLYTQGKDKRQCGFFTDKSVTLTPQRLTSGLDSVCLVADHRNRIYLQTNTRYRHSMSAVLLRCPTSALEYIL